MQKKTIKILALTVGETTPSSRFRVRQFIDPLSRMGCNVNEFTIPIERDKRCPLFGNKFRSVHILPFFLFWEILKCLFRIPVIFKTNRYDVVWLQKELMRGKISLEPFIRAPFIFDIDDAIWAYKDSRIDRMSIASIARLAETVVVGNEYLADWFRQYTKKIEIIPTAIDTDRFSPALQSEINHKKFVIGWTGLGSNLPFLYEIESPISKLMNKYSTIQLHILSNNKPAFTSLPADRVKFIPWEPTIENTTLKNWDVGIMPLPDTKLTRGKCSFKMLQYMATGIPVVVSPVGMNRAVLSKGRIGFCAASHKDWFESIQWLYLNRKEGKKLGRCGRAIVEQEYSRKVICERLHSLFMRTANKNPKIK